MKKTISFVLAAVLLFSLACPALSATGGGGDSSGGGAGREFWYSSGTTPSFYTQQGGASGSFPGSGTARADDVTATHYTTGSTTSLPILDFGGQSFNVPGGPSYNITNNLTNNSYYTVNNSVTNNIYNNSYTYNFNTYVYDVTVNNTYYEVTYAPTYVSIYYLDPAGGNREDFYYFELPDGRSSGDMYAYQMYGLAVSYDAVNYNVLYDAPNTLHLSHFDGDMKDSGYYNLPFVYASGASFNYIDSGTFGQALYWPPGVSRLMSFDSLDSLGDFTFEMRLYMTANTSSAFDLGYNVPTIGVIFKSDAGSLTYSVRYNESKKHAMYLTPSVGIKDSLVGYPSVPSGVWHHVAVVRQGDVVKVYLNGLYAFESSFSSACTGVSLSQRSEHGCAIYIDEVRLSKGAVYTENFVPPSAPFTTNRVFVLPEDVTANYTLAVKSEIPVTDYRVGGVRPSEATKGFVYLPLNGQDKVVDCQIYDGSDWLSVDGRIYVGGEWLSLTSYQVQEGELPDSDPKPDPDPDPDPPPGGSSGWDISGILDGIGAFFGAILSIAGAFLTGVASLVATITSLFTTLSTLGVGFTLFLAAVFPFIPTQIISILTLGFGLMVALSVLRFLRG